MGGLLGSFVCGICYCDCLLGDGLWVCVFDLFSVCVMVVVVDLVWLC